MCVGCHGRTFGRQIRESFVRNNSEAFVADYIERTMPLGAFQSPSDCVGSCATLIAGYLKSWLNPGAQMSADWREVFGDWLLVRDGALYNSAAEPVTLAGVSWRDHQLTRDDLAALAEQGVGFIRLPISAQTALDWQLGGTELHEFVSLLDAVREQRMQLILDLQGPPQHAAWQWLAELLQHDDAVPALVIRAQPATDDAAAKVVADAVRGLLSRHANVLVVVEGIALADLDLADYRHKLLPAALLEDAFPAGLP